MEPANITETVADFIKITAATSPPAMMFAGLPLDKWMYIMSIVASFLFIVDKAPAILRSIYGKIRK